MAPIPLMHIVIVTPTFFPIRGGTEQTIHEWASRLAMQHKVTIVSLLYTKSASHERLRNTLEVYRVPSGEIRFVGQQLRAFFVYRRLRAIHSANPIDVVHMGHVFHMGRAVMKFRKKYGVPVVTSLLGWDSFDPVDPLPKRAHSYMARIMNQSDRVVTMSHHVVDTAKAQGCTKDIRIIPHGATIHGRTSTISVHEKHAIPPGDDVIFSLQRLEPRKGLQFLLQAIPLVLKEHANTTFIIGGTGSREIELREQVEQLGVGNKVVFPGFIPDEELASYYDQSTVFALPTLYEAFGIVYVDAMARGLPIVTTAVGGALDIVTDEVGILVPPRDGQAFANGILKALNMVWDRKYLRTRSQRYNWDTIVAEYEQIYRELVNEATKSAH